MQGTVDSFSHGLVTPVAAFLMACLGAALGLRRTAEFLRARRPRKFGGPALGAASIGSGVWTMHFIGMTGFTVEEVPIGYDRFITFASLVVGIVATGIGIFIVGYRGSTPMALITGGTVVGLGIATTHYLAMDGLRLHGRIDYDTRTVALSVLIAVAASVTALWLTARRGGFLATLTASPVLGVASTGMHFTAMSGVEVHLDATAPAPGGAPATGLLAPMLVGPAMFLLLAGAALFHDPPRATGGGDAGPAGPGRSAGLPRTTRGPRRLDGVPPQRTRLRAGRDHRGTAGRTAVRAPRGGPRDPHGR